jgi:dCMP deaminase
MATFTSSREKWDKRFWELAKFVSAWSKDPAAKIGAVIATERGVIAMGYNGFPKGVEDSADRLEEDDTKLNMVVHAEQNALLIAGPAALGAEMFVWGKPVCSSCGGMIVQAGISRVVSMDPEKSPGSSKWKNRGIVAVSMLKEAGVEMVFME